MIRSAAFIAVLLSFLVGAFAPAHAERRVALVIGNGEYEHAPTLRNPRNDAEAVGALLRDLGFEVVQGADLDHKRMRRTIRDFAEKVDGADVALFFYAGHGLQVNGRNYLAPVDAKLAKEIDLEFEAFRLEMVLAHMERAAKTNLVFLDACRDNPLARNLARTMGTRSTAVGQGLARVETGVGTLIAFATQPGNVAFDGETRHSPFTAALIKHMPTPGLDVALVMRRVRQEVIEATKGSQVPWNNSSLTGTFAFKDKPAEPAADETAIAEMAFWLSAAETDSEASYRLYLDRYPAGPHAAEAREKLAKLAKVAEEAARARAAEAERRKKREAERASREAEWKAERERLARERADFERRLKELEAQARGRLEKQKREKKVAALEPGKEPKAEPEPEVSLDPKVMALTLQNELKRVGCNPGPVDGDWGGRSRSALDQFNRYAKLKLPTGEPTPQAIEALKARKARVCPEPDRAKSKTPTQTQTVKRRPPQPQARPTARKKCDETDMHIGYSSPWRTPCGL